jgi:hypothetical protein
MKNNNNQEQEETTLVAPLPTQEKEMNEHKNVYVALMAAQAQMGPLIKGEKNPHFKKMYAGLNDVVQAVRAPLNSNGLAFFHQLVEGNVMRTVLAHGESETQIQCDVPLIVSKNDMQGMKSATTYAKRIGLESVTGVAPEDDDGNDAANAAPPQQRQPTPQEAAAAKQKERAGSLSQELKATGTVEGIRSFWDDNVDEIKTFPQVTQDYLQQVSDKKEAELDEPPFTEAAE